IILDWSWFLVLVLFSSSLAGGYFPARFSGWPGWLYWLTGIVTALGLFGSVLLHELGHSLVARGFGVPVTRIRLFIFGGVAEMGDEWPHAGSEFLIAIAGPVVSVLTGVAAFVGWALLRVGRGRDLTMLDMAIPAPAAVLPGLLSLEALVGVLGYLAAINVVLAVFNMVPGFPLDGGRVLRSVVWGLTGSLRQATNIAVIIGRIVAFGFIGLGVVQIVTGSLVGGLWTIFIGIFMQGAGRAEQRSQLAKGLLQERFVAHLMMHNPQITRWAVPGLAPEITHGKSVSPDEDLWNVLKRMERNNIGTMPIMRDGQLLGILRREDILGYMQMLSAGGIRI
ncbi:MAG: site-2 protease family protein, partial [Anaerolineae bacterium]